MYERYGIRNRPRDVQMHGLTGKTQSRKCFRALLRIEPWHWTADGFSPPANAGLLLTINSWRLSRRDELRQKAVGLGVLPALPVSWAVEGALDDVIDRDVRFA